MSLLCALRLLLLQEADEARAAFLRCECGWLKEKIRLVQASLLCFLSLNVHCSHRAGATACRDGLLCGWPTHSPPCH